VSPLTLRRYRAERLLRQEFAGLRAKVLAVVRARLSARGVRLDAADLDSCYSQAWHGLYAAVLAGEQIASPAAWLTLVTFRRALDEHRARAREREVAHDEIENPDTVRHGAHAAHQAHHGPDLAAQLDDRQQLRQLFEGLRTQLSPRECQAASLCYLQGLSRAEAAAHMGISDTRMRKLMEGPRAGRPGVAGKVGELLDTIRHGGWCEHQSSLMRGLAFGILDPDGERHQLAQLHLRECPACRAYVVSLRGLAAVLPPVLLPWGLGLGALTGVGAATSAGASGGASASGGVGVSGGVGAGVAGGSGAGAAGGAGVGAAGGTCVGAGTTAGAAAAVGGAASGGTWLLAGGSVGAKLAMGCLIALGVGAGCGALIEGSHRHGHSTSPHQTARVSRVGSGRSQPGGLDESLPGALGQRSAPRSAHLAALASSSSARSSAHRRAASPAREFGLEAARAQLPSSIGHGSQAASAPRVVASQADLTGASANTRSRSSGTQASASAPGATREFGVG
jgi:RNA polymerase sigma factor (sigma-70 family)